MKRKLTKIMGVGLTVMLLASLVVVTTPAAADPGEDYWSSQSGPGEGYLYGWKLAKDASSVGLGPIAKAIDDDLYIYSRADGVKAASDHAILKSTSGGQTWSELTGVSGVTTDPGAAVVDFACSPQDADVVYYATASKVMKSINGGSTWAPLSLAITGSGTLDGITSIDCAEVGGNYVVVASSTIDDDVFLYDESQLVPVWAPLNTPTSDNVVAVALSPNYAEVTNRVIIAVTVDGTANTTNILTKVGGAVWGTTILDGTISSMKATGADIAFPDDYDYLTANVLYVGLDCTGGLGTGDVYQIIGGTSSTTVRDLAAGVDVASVDVDGSVALTHILAGEAGASTIHYSANAGTSWETVYKQPTGANDTYVLMADDFTDSGEAWAISGGADGGVSHTADYCDSWNQIGMMNIEIDQINDLSVNDDGVIFISTDNPGDCIRMDVTTLGVATVTVTAGAMKYSVYGALNSVSTVGSVTTITLGENYYGGAVAEVYCTALTNGTTATYAAGTGNTTNTIYRDADTDGSVTGNTAWSLPDSGTVDSIFRYASDWERVFSSTVYADADMVEMSPDYADTSAVFATDYNSTTIWRSIDGGNIWTAQPTAPPNTTLGWLVIDSTTLLTSKLKNVNKTTNNGLSWYSPAPVSTTSGNYITDFALKNGKIAAGSTLGFCYSSTDLGETFSAMYGPAMDVYWPSGGSGAQAYVAIADDGTIYATQPTGGVWRHRTSVYGDRIDNYGSSSPVTAGTGIAESGGTLYVIDRASGEAIKRSLDPTDSILGTSTDTPFFETVDQTQTATLTGTLDRLWMTEGKLWTIRNHSGIYVYEDGLSVPVAGLTATLDTTKATLTWDALGSATSYTYEVNTREDFLGAAIGSTPATTTLTTIPLTGLSAGTTYYWRVRGATPVLSLYSDVASFSTVMAVPDASADYGAPRPGATDVSPNAVFTWGAVSGAVGYNLEISTDATFTTVDYSASPEINAYAVEGLAYSTIYYWRVKAIGATSESAWVNGVFTTMASPEEEAAEPIVIVEPGEPGEVQIVEVPVPGPAQAIPNWMLMTIIAIGAVLVIALIVLIVRTRRVA